ncbi:MAG: hypothetical protein WKG00_01085 [Polyangiaceae bacterium]
MLAIATRRARDAAAHPLLGLPLLLLDVPLASRVELHLAAALASRARTALAVVPRGEEPRSAALAAALGVTIEDAPTGEPGAPATAVANVQTYLFASAAPSGAEEPDAVTVLSAPGESRECVELARVLHREAERGVPFDRMAVLLRAPGAYRAHLGEALRRAGIPAWFERGSRRPDPTGRAMLALLACVAEGLSARRFAEYLSLGQVPELAGDGKPSAVAPEAPRWVPPEDELLPARVAREEEEREDLEPPPPSGATPLPDDPEAVPAVSGNLRAPRRWERLIVDAAVIGGSNRWQRRLRGLAGELADKLATAQATGGDGVESIRRDMAMLGNLEAFALPLLDELATLPERARWGEWLEALAALAPRALRDPTRVLSVLAELAPMAEVGPVELGEVRRVLAERLGEVVSRPTVGVRGACWWRRWRRRAGCRSTWCWCPAWPSASSPRRSARSPSSATPTAWPSACARTPIASPTRGCCCTSPSAPRAGGWCFPTRVWISTRRGRACPPSTGWRWCAPPRGSCRASTS